MQKNIGNRFNVMICFTTAGDTTIEALREAYPTLSRVFYKKAGYNRTFGQKAYCGARLTLRKLNLLSSLKSIAYIFTISKSNMIHV
jgi:hypothetical protein